MTSSRPIYENLSDRLAASSSATIFNRWRNRHTERRFATFYAVDCSGRDLSAHDLSDARFSKCRFESVDFGILKNIEFADCSFVSCRFMKADHAPAAAIERTLFYLCSFRDTNFGNIGIADLQLINCRFETAPGFLGSRIKGLLRIEGCDSWRSFCNLPDAELRVDWETSVSTNMQVRSPLRIDWTSLRSLQHIPFLQASLVGLILLSIHTYLLAAIYYIIRLPEAGCAEMKQLLGKAAATLSKTADRLDAGIVEICSRLMPDKVANSITTAVAETMIMFLLLFAAALLHKLAGPSEIFEFSRTQWVIDQKKPAIFYEILAQQRLFPLTGVVILYLASVALFSYTFASKVLFIVRLH